MGKDKVKVIKQKKKINFASVWKFIRTLWKNDAVVEVATTTKWWWSLIIFVLSLVISVLPATVNQATAQGRNFLSGTNASYSDPYINGLYAMVYMLILMIQVKIKISYLMEKAKLFQVLQTQVGIMILRFMH